MSPELQFQNDRRERITNYSSDYAFRSVSAQWLEASMRRKYVYNFDWLGRPIIQYPQDMVAVQELIWKVRPDLIIETGIAHGGSLVLSASMLAMLDMCDAIEQAITIDPRKSRRKVIGVDIFGQPDLFQKQFRALLHGYAAEAAVGKTSSNSNVNQMAAKAFREVAGEAAATRAGTEQVGKFSSGNVWVHLYSK
jgi:cephalosporin hydroxylase